MIGKYFKNNITKCLPLVIFSFVFVLLFLYSYSIVNANNYLSDEVKNRVSSEIELSGRMFSLDASDDFIYSGGDNVREELNDVINLLDKNDASYDLTCLVRIPDVSRSSTGFDNDHIITYLTALIYGIDNDDYFKMHNIEIIDNDYLNGDEYGIIVNENLYVPEYENVELGIDDQTNGERQNARSRKIEVGDTIDIPLTINKSAYLYGYYGDEYISFTVVGLYKERNVDMETYMSSDYMLNNRMYVTKDGFMNLVDTYFDLFASSNTQTIFNNLSGSISQIRFNNVEFDIESYDELNEVRQNLQGVLSRISSASISRSSQGVSGRLGYTSSTNGKSYVVSTTEDLVNKIISPFSSLSENINMYKNIFIVISIVLFGLIILFNTRNRIKESSIKMSMGMKYDDVLFEIIIENMIIVLAGCLLAIIVYNLTVTKIVNNMLAECIDLQNSLYRITSKDINGLDDAFSIFTDFSNVKVGFVYYLLIIAICTLIAVLLTVLVYKTNQPKNVKKALMSV